MKTFLTFSLLLGFLIDHVAGQFCAPPIQWQKSLGSAGPDILYGFLAMPDNGVLLYGSSACKYGQGNRQAPCVAGDDFYVVRLDAKVNILWKKVSAASSLHQFHPLSMAV